MMRHLIMRMLVTVLSVFAMLCITACENDMDSLKTLPDESSEAQLRDDSAQVGTSDAEGGGKALRIESASIVDPSSFKDGVAWITTEETRLLIDGSGTILLDMAKLPYSSISSYHQGAALGYGTKWTYDYLGNDPIQAIVDQEGEATWSLENEGQAKADEVYGSENVLKVYAVPCLEEQWNGFLIVAFDVDAFDFTGTAYGVVDGAGSWVVEPPSISVAARRDGKEKVYYGDHFLRVGDSAVVLYRTGEVLECTRIDEVWGGIEYGGIDINDLEKREKALACQNMLYSDSGVFEDDEGKTVLDISGLSLAAGGIVGKDGDIAENAFSESDYCLVTLENSQGGRYITIIDTAGRQMFDPIREGDHGPLSGNAFFYNPGNPEEAESDEETGYFVDINGHALGDVKGSESKPFSEGRAWIFSQGEWRCIDENGRIVI